MGTLVALIGIIAGGMAGYGFGTWDANWMGAGFLLLSFDLIAADVLLRK